MDTNSELLVAADLAASCRESGYGLMQAEMSMSTGALRTVIAVEMGVEPAALDGDTRFRDLGTDSESTPASGLDSRVELELRNRMEAALGDTLPDTG